MRSATSVGLFPDSPEIVLCGGPSEASGAAITGRVVMSTRQAAQLVRLRVALRPRRARLFQTQQSVAPAEQYSTVLVADGETLEQVVHGALRGGAHEWRFSIAVPGTLAETVYGRDCFVAYELVASAQSAGTFGGTAHSQAHPIAVKRVPRPDCLWSLAASQAVNESATWRGRVELSLVAASHIVHDQQRLAVRGVIRPLEKGLALRRAGFQIVEHITHNVGLHGTLQPCLAKRVVVDNMAETTAAGDLPCEPASTALAAHVDQELLVQETSVESRLSVPPAYTGIQYDIRRGPARTSHELVLFVTIADAHGCTHRLRLATPVYVLPRADAYSTSPPRYEDAAADRLVAADADAQQRDRDFWSEFVLVDIAGAAGAVVQDTLTACPLALEGYCVADEAQPPPPPYPGAASAIERTLVAASTPDLLAPQQPVRRQQQRLCSGPFRRRSLAQAHSPGALTHVW